MGRSVAIKYTPARKKHCASITLPPQSKIPIRFCAAIKYDSACRYAGDRRKTAGAMSGVLWKNGVAIEPCA